MIALAPLLALVGVAAIVVACGSRRGGFDGDEDKDASTTPGLGGGNDGGPGPCEPTCSADLHAITQCGNVVATCPADQGCANAKCVPACEAAAANKSSIGCDYLVYPPPFFSGSTACLGAFVANTWGSPLKISVSRGSQTFTPETFSYIPTGNGDAIVYAPLTNATVPPNSVALVLLNRETNAACPGGTQTATGAVAVAETGIGEAFRIRTDAPAVAYDIFPYGGGATAVTSATLLIPTTAWGDNYVGTTAHPLTIGSANPWLGIVAAEDGTTVTVSPPVAINGGPSVTGTPAGQPVTYTLNAGQYVQLSQATDLTGAIIQANKPIGSWAGNRCTQVPGGKTACDGMHQQIPPVRALGSRYAAVRYRNRYPGVEESPPWRILGAVDGTTLTYDPPQPGAPTTIKSGEMVMFNAAGPFVVSSQDAQHPFFFASYMTGCNDVAPGNSDLGCAGDPEFVNVVPPDQYLASYVFFTDPTYPDTNLVFVREKAADGAFKDVELDCIGKLGDWQAINGTFEYTRVDLIKGNFEKQGSCDNGRHLAKSTARFGLTVWGWGSAKATSFSTQAVSYAYPAGASVVPINDVVVPPTVK